MYGKGFLGNMTENLQADCVQSCQAGFMQRFPNFPEIKKPLCITHGGFLFLFIQCFLKFSSC